MSIGFNPADFTPQLVGYTGQGAFRFWCQKVLPIVYDDSLSYYELLNKVVVYLNNVISDVAATETNVTELYDAYNNLQTFVNDFFENLSVDEEINNKLDSMAEDGTLSALIEPFIPAIITDWLNTHITPTSPPVDNTLSVEGAAADAKVTGEKIGELKTNSIQYRGILDGTNVTPDSVEEIGYWAAHQSAVTSALGRVGPAGMFLNLRQPPYDLQQIFILTDGRVYTRYQKSGAFSSLNVAVQREMVDNPDTITDTGLYACVGAKTAIYTGINVSSMFLSLTNASGSVVWQGFLLPGGKIFSRYGTTGEFTLDRPNRVKAFVPNHPLTVWTEGNFQKVKISAGNYTLPEEKTGSFVISEDVVLSQTVYSSFEFAVLDTATQEFSVVSRNTVISETQVVLFVFYADKLLNVAVSPEMFPQAPDNRVRAFVPNKPLVAWTENLLQKVKISAGNYTLPEERLGSFSLSEDVILSQTSYSTFQFAVLDVETKTFSVVPLNTTLSDTQVVLFVFYAHQLLNVCVAPEMFPRQFKGSLRTINDCFAPMFNRTGTPFKIVLGGDSITHGVGGTGFSQNGETIIGNYKRNPDGYCWANLFKSYIESNYNATVLNNGVTGTQSYWWDYNKSTLIPSDTDLFILTIGTNNRIKMEGRTGTTHDEQIDNYYTQMKSVIDYCTARHIPILLCSSIPASQANEDLVQNGEPVYPSHVYEFNGVLQRLTSEYNMEYFNLYEAFYYYAQQNNLDFATMLPDGLHPNDSTYRIMFYLYLKGFNLAPSYVPVSLPD